MYQLERHSPVAPSNITINAKTNAGIKVTSTLIPNARIDIHIKLEDYKNRDIVLFYATDGNTENVLNLLNYDDWAGYIVANYVNLIALAFITASILLCAVLLWPICLFLKSAWYCKFPPKSEAANWWEQ